MSLKKYLGIHRIFLFCCFTFFTFCSQAQDASVENTDEQPLAESRATGPHIRVALLSEDQALVPNTQQYLAIEVQPDPEWHTYWLNPGDSGEPPKVTWSENTETLSFGDIQWPTPSAIPVAHLVNYGYSGQHLLIVPINSTDSLRAHDSVKISAALSWLVCKEDCIPGWATLHLQLPVDTQTNKTPDAPLFEKTRTTLPSEIELSSHYEINEDTIAIKFSLADINSLNTLNDAPWEVFPERNDLIDHAAQQQQIVTNNAVSVLLKRSAYFDPSSMTEESNTLRFLVKQGEKAYYLNSEPNTQLSEADTLSGIALLGILGFAFLGGLILNVMPCVLPILSIKALAMQQEHTGLLQKSAYFLGVVVSFNAFAILIILLQQGGEQLGWGFHMQSPLVIWLLAFLFTFIALVLLDLFTIGTRMAGFGNGLVAGNNAQSHFFTGVLAVIVASPCTAPFMAAALGVALVSEPYVTVLIFNALAIGFALPLTLLFASERLRNYFPKPGNWMVTFKHFLAFPMFFTVAWLAWVFASQQGTEAQFILLLSLILFALFAWLMTKTRLPWLYCALMILLVALPLTPASTVLTATTAKVTDVLPQNSIDFNADTLEQLKAEQKVVLVNMTADWCITCKVNEQVALNTQAVSSALTEDNVTYMVGDWTNKNDEILNYLKRYERAGVPLYVVYAGTNSYTVLPQMLSPGIVVNALKQAQEELSNVN